MDGSNLNRPMLASQYLQFESPSDRLQPGLARGAVGTFGGSGKAQGRQSLSRRVSPDHGECRGDIQRKTGTASNSAAYARSGGVRSRVTAGARPPYPQTGTIVLEFTLKHLSTDGRRALSAIDEVCKCAGECVLGAA